MRPTVPEAWSKRLRWSQSLAKAAVGSSGVGRRTWSSDRSIHVGHVAGPSIIGPALSVPALSEQAAFVEPHVGGPGHARRLVTVDQ